ncbi:flagellar basal body-associated protein FliL [Edaphovirga cremea]|uniref:flagellar basal body-associated protein FliL n=1 Tax=Edaphovirga cremea TaxID=2267246 RepID=UPI003989A8A3
MSDQAIAAKRKRSVWVVLLLLIAVAACGAAGYSWWMLEQHKTGAVVELKPRIVPAPVFMALDTFTVNLQTTDNNTDRVLYVGLTLRLPDEATRSKLSDYLPEVRSRLLLLLARQQAESLSSEAGKQQLVSQIKAALSPSVIPGQPNQVVSDVLFTAFILR